MEEKASVQVKITGYVQGVGFRFFAERVARRLGLTGSVMNRRDGSVFVHAEGQREDLLAFLDHLKRGPSGAYVEGFTITWGPYEGWFEDFTIRFSG